MKKTCAFLALALIVMAAPAVAVSVEVAPAAQGTCCGMVPYTVKITNDLSEKRSFELTALAGRYTEAEQLLARCLELSPSFSAARHNYAIVLQRLGRSEDALREVDSLLATDPRNLTLGSLKAAALARLGEYERSIALYESVLEDYPGQAKLWMSLCHAVKTTGRQQRCIEVYRRSIELEPSLGEAWWSLANLKTYRFGADDVAAMRAQVVRMDLADEDRLHFHFALGKALEDAGEFEESFRHYAEGNAIRRKTLNYDAAETTNLVGRSCRLFTPEFFAQRRGAGCPAPDPIFIVGLPRAGSTLIEQILASHSQVEGTAELPDIGNLARGLVGPGTRRENIYRNLIILLSWYGHSAV